MAIEDKDSTGDVSVAPIVGPDDPRRFTDSGIEIAGLYTEADVPADLPERLGRPGEPPYTRGVHGEMYRKRLWTMRQYAGYASAKESNERYKYLLANGSTGLSMAFDLPDAARPGLRRPDVPRRGRAHRASPSTRSTTCGPPSTASRSTRSPRR
jgi:methylmalonyl-CoA mutase N-terminal domain/subunit